MKRDQGLTRWDLALIAGIVAFSACWWLYRPGGGEPSTVRVYAGSRLFAELPVSRDAVVRVPGPLGVTVVEVHDGHARVVSSPCPDKLCVRMGAVRSPGESVLCIPNQVLATVGPVQGKLDAVTY
jgi:hypothetical protein